MDSAFWTDVLSKASGTLSSVFGQNMDFRYGRDDVGDPTHLFDFTSPSPAQGPTNPFMSLIGMQGQSLFASPQSRGSSLTALATRPTSAYFGPATAGPDEDPEIVNYITQAAQRRGIDPSIALAVARKEGGKDGRLDAASRNRQNFAGQPAYGPFQLHINGPQSPYMGDEALAAGIDPRDPNTWQRQVDFALDRVLERGWSPFYAARAQGIQQWQGIGQRGTGYGPQQQVQAQPTVPAAQNTGYTGTSTDGIRDLRGITPAQYGQGLDKSIADAICGPIAATAFARAAGRNPNFGEVLNMARDIGWTAAAGMGGWGNAVKLIERLGIPAVADRIDKNRIISELRSGRPVVFDTDGGENGHYFVVEGYNAATDTFELGESARALRRSGGRSAFRLEEIASLGTGNPYMAIYMRTN